MKKLFSSVLLLLAVLSGAARAQSLTVGCSSPPPAYGVVWTAGQWITCLSSLQAQLGYTPLNVAGGAMSGQLFLAPSVTTNAPLNFPLGAAPTSPANGDLWFTSSGLFYRAGGSSIGPLASASGGTLNNPTFTGTATFPDGTTWTSSAITPGTAPWLSLIVTGQASLGGAAGAEGLRVNVTASAVNRFEMTGAASTGRITINANGETNVGITYLSRGNASHLFRTNGGGGAVSQAEILHTASADRYLTLTGGVSGSSTSPLMGASSGPVWIGTGTNHISITGGTTPAINTSAGNLTAGSAGGTTSLSDAAVKLSNAAYFTCAALGTNASGTITCGGAPSGYITYNDNVTTSTLAVSGNEYCMNTASGALTLTMPLNPANGDYVAFSDCGGNFAVHALTIANNSKNIMYNAGVMLVTTPYAGGVLRYSLGKTSWILQPL